MNWNDLIKQPARFPVANPYYRPQGFHDCLADLHEYCEAQRAAEMKLRRPPKHEPEVRERKAS